MHCWWYYLIIIGMTTSIICKKLDSCLGGKCVCSRSKILCRRKKLKQNPLISLQLRTGTPYIEEISEIDLSYNLLTTLHGNSFWTFVNLRKLILRGNSLEEIHEASFNVSRFPSRHHYSKIKHLDLSKNHLLFFPRCFGEVIPSLAPLTDLKALLIGGNFFGEKMETISFSQISNLEKLDMSNNLIQRIPNLFFKKLVHLRDLDLSNNILENLPCVLFSYNVPLKILRLSNNALTSFPKNLPSSLEELFLNKNKFKNLRKIDFKSLNINNLRVLDLNKNQIEFLICHDFQHFPELELLDLSHNVISVVDANCFSYLKKLKYLFLHNNQLLRHIVNYSTSNFPNLEYLVVHSCSLKSLEIFGQSEITKTNSSVALKKVWLFGNPIQCDCKMKTFVQFVRKHNLKLDPTNFTDATEVLESKSKTTLLKKLLKLTRNVNSTACVSPLNRYRTVVGKLLISVPESDLTCPYETKYLLVSYFVGIIAFFGVIPFVSVLICVYLSCRKVIVKYVFCDKEKED